MEQFTSEWQAWHDERLAALATPFGMLSITGLHWLQQGENTWEGAPGRFDLDGDTITFRIGAGHSAGPTRAALEAAAQQETQTASAVELGSTADGASWIRLPRDGARGWSPTTRRTRRSTATAGSASASTTRSPRCWRTSSTSPRSPSPRPPW